MSGRHRFDPQVMSRWIGLGATVVRELLDASRCPRSDEPVTLASFARRMEDAAPKQGLVPSEDNVRWVWKSLLAHAFLSDELRAWHKDGVHRAVRAVELLPAGSLVLLELAPGSGLLRAIKEKVRVPNEWALVELRRPLTFDLGRGDHVQCREAECRVAFRPRQKPPGAEAPPDAWHRWASERGPAEVRVSDSLNHAAQTASTQIERQRRTHSVNVFDHGWWLRDDGTVVALDEIRRRIEYFGVTDPEEFARLRGRWRHVPEVGELLRALGLLRPHDPRVALEATDDRTESNERRSARAIRAGMRVRYASGLVALVLAVQRDGLILVQAEVPGGGVDIGAMPVWRFVDVEVEPGRWVPIELDEQDRTERDFWQWVTGHGA